MARNFGQSLAGAVVALFLVSAVVAQSTKDVPLAPVPARILTAKTIFVANGGQDEQPTDNPAYNGARDRAYNELYAALQTWGRYKLVTDPAEADLVLEIRFVVQWPSLRGTTLSTPDHDPEFRLAIRDPKTNVLLWRFTERAPWAILQGNRERNFDQALAKIVGDLQALGAPGPDAGNGVKP